MSATQKAKTMANNINKTKTMMIKGIAPSQTYIIPGIKVYNYTPHDLIKDVADYFNLTTDKIKEKTRVDEVRQPRQIAMYFMKLMFLDKYSLKGIGQIMGGYNHATVLHSVRVVKNDIDTDENFRQKIKGVQSLIDSHVIKQTQLIEKS